MSERTFDGVARPEYWIAHVRAGVLLTEIAGGLVLVYVALAPDLDGRARLTVAALAAGAMAATGAILLLPLREILSHRRASLFFYAWSLSAAAVTTVGVLLTGGSQSPLVALYFIILVYAATAYPPKALIRVASLIVGAYVAMALRNPEGVATGILVGGALALSAWMSAVTARNQWRQLEEQTELARIDGLTGCLNQRTFREALDAEVERARRFGHPLAFLLVDLDEFKLVNDNRGHLAGDAVLSTIGSILRESVRRIDVVGRLGGDEFGVALIESGPDRALDVARRIHRRCRNAAGVEGITVSIGVAHLERGASSSATSLFGAADGALYEAKHAGRDTIRVATGT